MEITLEKVLDTKGSSVLKNVSVTVHCDIITLDLPALGSRYV